MEGALRPVHPWVAEAARRVRFGIDLGPFPTLAANIEWAQAIEDMGYDISIQGLQRRGVLFLACHKTINAHGGQIASSAQNPDQQTAAEIAAEIQAHLIPGGLLAPAGVGGLVRLQDKSFRLVVNA